MIVNLSFMEKGTAMMRGEKKIFGGGGRQVVISRLKKSRSSVEGDPNIFILR